MSYDQSSHGHLMWKIAGGLIVIVALAGTWMWLDSKDTVPETAPPDATATASETSPTVKQDQSEVVTASSEEVSTVEDQHALVTEDILQTQVPQQPALAKEEIAKLDDIQQQLLDQQKSLEAQQADADQLIQLKEEQIKLLEQQLNAKG